MKNRKAVMDSDDEYERGRRRDKFRRERSDYRDRRERDDRRRDNWADRRDGRENYRNDFNRRPYQNYSRGRSDNYRDQMSPPNKRPRRDWEPNYYNDRYGNQGYSQGGWNQSREKGPRRAEKDSTQLLSFKQFLTTQEDNIDDQEAVKKYNEYKLEFKKGQLSDFFLAHKDEECLFVRKPEQRLGVPLNGVLVQDEVPPSERERENYKKLVRQRQRLHIFMEIFNKEILARGGLDASSAPDLMKIMDTTLILMYKVGIAGLYSKIRVTPILMRKTRRNRERRRGKRENTATAQTIALVAAASQIVSPTQNPHRQQVLTVKATNLPSLPWSLQKPAEGSADGKKVEEDKPPKPEELDEEPKPRALHKTFSLFFPQHCPGPHQEGDSRYPSPERAWNRHGWVTFDRSVNIKEICWNLSNIRLKDCELSPVVNRDLTHRIRAVSGITAHKTIVKSDLKLAARLIQLLDEESKVWDKSVMPTNPDVEPEPPAPPKEEEKKEEKKPEESEDAPNPPEEPPPAPLPPAKPAEPQNEVELLPPPTYERNPVLENITEFLVDETSAEEQLLLGSDLEEREEGQEDSNEIQFERDPAGSKVLDRLLCYLRFVHSVDYYSCSKFHIEDDMPSRCGLMHVRGANPPNRLTQKDMEKFITANTQELAKDKWLCPLSGKKFKGPEFVRKHIFNKHSEKIDAVRKEVEYFNNYLGDVDRPQPPDPTPVTAQPPAQQNQGGGGPGGGGYNQQQQVTLGTTMAPGTNNHHSSHRRGETTSTEEEEERVEGVTSTSKVIISYMSRFHESLGR
ncbi:Serrate RNA effector molecule-like protein [Apostichopus japonicus]|uniref:Serrate RNA effector molecule-like protein n=1 Tax=Stichopus japonicus TaxID=307972 RepID=A0A2G8JFF6_STIJA|nr:Serrate RNA effector molecule-like protein [Apostichopus japonicus]